MQPEFHISHREEDERTVVEIHGEIDSCTVPRIRDHVVHRLETGRRRLAVDLAGVTSMGSTGLGSLVGIRKRIRPRTGDLRLVITHPEVLRIFRATGLDRVSPIHGSVEPAMTE